MMTSQFRQQHRFLHLIITLICLCALAFIIFGPITNLILWAFTEKWYYPHLLPLEYGVSYWSRVFASRGDAIPALFTSISIAVLVVLVALILAIPAGYALARLKLPGRSLILFLFLIPQAFPDIPVYVNIAQLFYRVGLNGTIPGVVLVHVMHSLVYAVWISSAAFAAIPQDLEDAARSVGASKLQAFKDVALPLAIPGIIASAIFVFLDSMDEFTGSYFVGAPNITTLPLLLYTASSGGNYQIASITSLLLLLPSILFMLVVERFLKADVLSKIGR